MSTSTGSLVLLFALVYLNSDSIKASPVQKSVQEVFRDHFKKYSDPSYVDFSSPTTRIGQLYSKATGLHMRVMKGGLIDGLGEPGEKEAEIQMETVGYGLVRIRGNHSGLYICLDKDGKVVTRRKNDTDMGCVFHEEIQEHHYTVFRSAAPGLKNCYLGISGKGEVRPACKLTRTHQAAMFLIRGTDEKRNIEDLLLEPQTPESPDWSKRYIPSRWRQLPVQLRTLLERLSSK